MTRDRLQISAGSRPLAALLPIVLLTAFTLALISNRLSAEDATAIGSKQHEDSHAPGSESEYIRSSCGPNVIYLLLKSKGYTTTLADVINRCTVSGGGMSLQTLADVAREFGYHGRLIKATDESLDRLTVPFVVHQRSEIGGATSVPGHFVLVIQVSRSSVSLLDGTTGELSTVSRRFFNKGWTGYALVEGAEQTPLDRILFVTAVGSGAFLAWLLSPLLVQFKWRHSLKAALVCAVAFIGSGCDQLRVLNLAAEFDKSLPETMSLAEDSSLEDDIWRVPERDGVNVLFVLMHYHRNSPVAYSRLRQAIPDALRRPSLADLKRAAAQVGFPVVVQSWSLEQIRDYGRPVITSVEQTDASGGEFVILAPTISDKTFVMLNGSLMSVSKMQTEDLYRIYSGYVLIPQETSASDTQRVFGGLLLVGAGLIQILRSITFRRVTTETADLSPKRQSNQDVPTEPALSPDLPYTT